MFAVTGTIGVLFVFPVLGVDHVFRRHKVDIVSDHVGCSMHMHRILRSEWLMSP